MERSPGEFGMTAFSMYDVFIAVIVGAFIGIVVVASTNSRQRSANPGALTALQQRMGQLYNVCLFATGALPVLVMGLLASLRTAPTVPDTLVMIVAIALAMLAGFTLHGNVMKLLDERVSSSPAR
jgi:hypothetical protein